MSEINYTPGTSQLRVHYEDVAILALRILHPRTYIVGHTSTNELSIINYQRIVETVEHHFSTHLPGEYSAMSLNALYHACLTPIPSMGEPIRQELFTRAAIGLLQEPLDLPGLVFPTSGIEAVARSVKKIRPIVEAAFHAVKVPDNTGDVLIKYEFP